MPWWTKWCSYSSIDLIGSRFNICKSSYEFYPFCSLSKWMQQIMNSKCSR